MTTIDDGIRGKTWFERDYPVLRATAEILEEGSRTAVMSAEIAERTSLAHHEVVKALDNLSTRYVRVQDMSSLAGKDLCAVGLTADGLVAADVWPSPDAVVERLIAALERSLDEAPEGSKKEKRIATALNSLRELGVGGTGNVLGAAVSSALGLS